MNGKPCASPGIATCWEAIDWQKVLAYVKKLQVRIVKAQKEGHYSKVKSLQWLLTHLLHQLGKGFFQFLFAQLPAVYDQRNYFLFNFFLHDLSRSFPQICRENRQALRWNYQTAKKDNPHLFLLSPKCTGWLRSCFAECSAIRSLLAGGR